ncbi:MAG: hypothetical protein K0S71_1781 [Clostridia bacterium]|jgi:GAF domain-containing protein|nr:hypothetical protein [Clostridia bacterium]
MQSSKTTNKAYCYAALLQAIDFFTQRFSLDQIGCYAFEFANEMLTLHSSGLFIREGDHFNLKKSRLYEVSQYEIPNTRMLEKIPVFHGDIITHQTSKFFTEDIIKKFGIKLVIPLIMDNFLYGFIISNGKILNHFDEDDYTIASTLTKLFRNALENSMQLDELNEKNKELDQKVFNLFAINQSAKSLLSEVDLKRLYTLATDIFSEMTCSQVTSFGIYDSISQSIKVLGYRNVSNYSSVFIELQLSCRAYLSGPIVLDFKKDLELIKSVFTNWEEFYLLEAEYIVLLVKDQILGIVTLGKAVNDRLYDHATFELVETLASFTHIAISNALLFKELVTQNERVERKYHTLNALNQIMQTLNQAASIEEISALTLKVLALNFGIEKAFFAYENEKLYTITQCLGLDIQDKVFELNTSWEKTFTGEMILDFKEDAAYAFFDSVFMSDLGSTNCIVIAPICSSHTYDYETSFPKGFLVVLQTSDGLKEEEILLIDTITKNISPAIYQMDLNRHIKENYKVDTLRELMQAIALKLEERKSYALDFYLYYKIAALNPFKKSDDLLVEGEECYIVDNFIFILTYDEIEVDDFCRVPYFESLVEIENFDYIGFYELYKSRR